MSASGMHGSRSQFLKCSLSAGAFETRPGNLWIGWHRLTLLPVVASRVRTQVLRILQSLEATRTAATPRDVVLRRSEVCDCRLRQFHRLATCGAASNARASWCHRRGPSLQLLAAGWQLQAWRQLQVPAFRVPERHRHGDQDMFILAQRYLQAWQQLQVLAYRFEEGSVQILGKSRHLQKWRGMSF